MGTAEVTVKFNQTVIFTGLYPSFLLDPECGILRRLGVIMFVMNCSTRASEIIKPGL